MVDSDKPKMII